MKRLLLLSLLLPATCHAEVMDKEPSLAFLAVSWFVLSALAYLSARRLPWLLVLVLPAAALVLGGAAVETTDPSVGPAMAAEAGAVYVAAPWAALLSVVAVTAFGLWRRRCAPNNSSKPTPLRGAA